MKKIDFKSKKFLWWVIGLLILVIVAVFVYRGLKGNSIKIWNYRNDKVVDIASSKDYSKYENKIVSVFEGEWVLNFSFLHKNEIKVEQGTGVQARWFKLVDASSSNDVTLYFTYEGGRGWSADDYINEVLKSANADVTVTEVKFADESDVVVKYVIDEKNNTEYYVEPVKNEKGESWLAIVENTKADNDNAKAIAKDLIRSLNTN